MASCDEIKILNAKKIIRLASSLSKEYYKKPLVVLDSEDVNSKVLLDLMALTLKDEEYEVVKKHPSDFISFRLNVLTYRNDESHLDIEAFGVKGITDEATLFFSYDHTKQVHKEATGDDVWDCPLIIAMRYQQNTFICPLFEFTGEDIEGYLNDN